VEQPLSLWVNGRHWATLMSTPVARRQLALGFAYFNGLFEDLSEVLGLEECLDDPNRISLRLARQDLPSSPAILVSSGCGQGVVLSRDWPEEPVPPGPPPSSDQVSVLMRELQERSAMHREIGGTHASALSDGQGILALYEDIGRHNTLDKLMGHALLLRLDTAGKVLVTSGRVSSEMLHKALRMRVSTVISRTAPTDMAVDLAERFGLGLIGYARGRGYTVFCGGAPAP